VETNNWLASINTIIESGEPITAERIKEILSEVDLREADETLRTLVNDLVESPLTCDADSIQDQLCALEFALSELKEVLGDKEKAEVLRGEKGGVFEDTLRKVAAWLDEHEAQADALEPVALDVQLIFEQIEQITVCHLNICHVH